MNKVPIPSANAPDKVRLTKLVEHASKLATEGDMAGLGDTEREIDEIVYRLFDLTPDEIAHIEGALVNTHRTSCSMENEADDE